MNNEIPMCGEEGLNCMYYDPDKCLLECMLLGEETDDYAYNEDDQPEYGFVYEAAL